MKKRRVGGREGRKTVIAKNGEGKRRETREKRRTERKEEKTGRETEGRRKEKGGRD